MSFSLVTKNRWLGNRGIAATVKRRLIRQSLTRQRAMPAPEWVEYLSTRCTGRMLARRTNMCRKRVVAKIISRISIERLEKRRTGFRRRANFIAVSHVRKSSGDDTRSTAAERTSRASQIVGFTGETYGNRLGIAGRACTAAPTWRIHRRNTRFSRHTRTVLRGPLTRRKTDLSVYAPITKNVVYTNSASINRIKTQTLSFFAWR